MHARNVLPIRAILFDKDGTIVDFDRTWGPAVQAVLRHLAGGNAALYRKLSAESGLVDGTHFAPGSPLIEEPTSVFAARWATLLRRPADPAFFGEIDRLLCEATTAHLAVIDDPKAVMSELVGRGYQLGLITNDAEATARVHVRKLGLDRILAFVAGYDSGFGVKPGAGTGPRLRGCGRRVTSGERGAAVIGGIIHNKKRVLESGIVFNQGVVPNLPADAAVEVPVMADAAGIHPISLGPLPESVAKLLNTQVNVQQLAVEAAVHASKEIALQALLIDPVVNSASAAVKLLDELWDVNRPYIRPCV